MAMRLATLFILALTSFASFGNDGCTAASEFQPSLCPVTLPKIVTIQIERNGAKAPAEGEATDCSGFKLSERAVRRFLDRAWKTDESDAHHVLDWSPCYASGTLVFRDGRKARWSIDQYRTGSISIEDGDRIFLYCPECRYRPFKW